MIYYASFHMPNSNENLKRQHDIAEEDPAAPKPLVHKRQRTTVNESPKRGRDDVEEGEEQRHKRSRLEGSAPGIPDLEPHQGAFCACVMRNQTNHTTDGAPADSVSAADRNGEEEKFGGVSYLKRRRLQELAQRAAVAEFRERATGTSL